MKKILVLLISLFSLPTFADLSISMNLVNEKGIGSPIGDIKVSASKYGAVFLPNLQGLPDGLHGFHIHQNPSCMPGNKGEKIVPALSAGSHYDPGKSKKHSTPWGDGHLGDLPGLIVDSNGKANQPVLAPRVKIADLKGRSLMIHAGGDNYSDQPKSLGGGGARIACGISE